MARIEANASDSHFFASTYRNELPSVWSSSVITNVAHVSSALASWIRGSICVI
jgi:hypothetical protein